MNREEGVSCLCLTYGRPFLLEESIQCFLNQDWKGSSELIIVNDHPLQKLILEDKNKNIVLINLPRKIRTLGEKRNFSVSVAKYDNLLIWDDDDIYLPWRITETMKTLKQNNFYKCPLAWVMNKGKLESDIGFNLFHGSTAYTRWLYNAVNGYKFMNGGEDSEIEGRIQNITEKKGEFWIHTYLSNDKVYYIYRWDHGSFHTSGVNDLNIIDSVINQLDEKLIEGEVVLAPNWKQDYVKLVKEKIPN